MLDLDKYSRRAEADPGFKERLLQNANQAIKDEFGEDLPYKVKCHEKLVFEIEPMSDLADADFSNVAGGSGDKDFDITPGGNRVDYLPGSSIHGRWDRGTKLMSPEDLLLEKQFGGRFRAPRDSSGPYDVDFSNVAGGMFSGGVEASPPTPPLGPNISSGGEGSGGATTIELDPPPPQEPSTRLGHILPGTLAWVRSEAMRNPLKGKTYLRRPQRPQ